MKYKFAVTLNDRDYLDYNMFWMSRSPYGKKQLKSFRMILTVIFAGFIAIALLSGGFSADNLLSTVPLLLVLILAQIFLTQFFSLSLKWQIKTLKKSGKMGYSPESVLEFYEDAFCEITPENKTEHRYSMLERVSIVDGKTVYLHVNNVMSYILPLSCFESKEQYEDFLKFIGTKCENMDRYFGK